MGRLQDMALLEAHEGYRSMVRAAAMLVGREIEDAPADPANPEAVRERIQQLGIVASLIREMQGATDSAYLARLRWSLASEPAVLAAMVKNGSVDVAKLADDALVLGPMRAGIARLARIERGQTPPAPVAPEPAPMEPEPVPPAAPPASGPAPAPAGGPRA